MVSVGSHGIYEWLVTDHDIDLLHICPEIVIGKYVAITAIDSGVFIPTQDETTSGWESRGNIAYSPKVAHIESLPREGYDEWYIFADPFDLGTSRLAENVFEVPIEPGHLDVFVNYGSFALGGPEEKALSDLFWQQIEWIRPESYIADGHLLNLVTTNKIVFTKIRDAVRSLG
jgi:hypothetical protein